MSTPKIKATAKPNASAVGRPTKRTPEVEARLMDALRKGNTRRASCASAGISDETLANWAKDSLDFLDALTRAENLAEIGYLDVIQESSLNGDWKAAAWWLERRRKAEYSSRTEVTGADGGALKVETTAAELTDDELAAIIATRKS